MQSSSSRSKRKSEVTFAVNDERSNHSRPRKKMQRRNSKVGRMFFADMNQTRNELRTESRLFGTVVQSSLPLDQRLGRKESDGVHRLRQLGFGLGVSIFDDADLQQVKNQDLPKPAPFSSPLSTTDSSIDEIMLKMHLDNHYLTS
jgi:hypothetical protein